MKFLVDRCAGRKLADWLKGQEHDVLESKSLGPDPGDRELLEIASEQRRALIIIDTDFGELVFVDRVPHSGIIRLPDVPAQRRIKLIEEVLRQYLPDLAAGAIITIRGERIRISKPPV